MAINWSRIISIVKNVIIVALALVVVGLGGWVVYDKAPNSESTSPNSNVPTSVNGIRETTGKTLDLRNQGLAEVDSNIYGKTDIVVLILSNNKLKSLKSEMGKMIKLEVLKLDHNLLEGSLIAEIRMLPLKTLDVSHNKMTGIPAEIGQLNYLETLDYSYNNISAYPDEIANLKQLKTLNLTGNPLSAEKIAELKSKLPHTKIIY